MTTLLIVFVQTEAAATIASLQQQVAALGAERAAYRQQAAAVESQLSSLRALLQPLPPLLGDGGDRQAAALVNMLTQGHWEADLVAQMEALRSVYGHVMSRFKHSLEGKQGADKESKRVRELSEEVAHLQQESDQLKSCMENRDSELKALREQVECVEHLKVGFIIKMSIMGGSVIYKFS